MIENPKWHLYQAWLRGYLNEEGKDALIEDAFEYIENKLNEEKKKND